MYGYPCHVPVDGTAISLRYISRSAIGHDRLVMHVLGGQQKEWVWISCVVIYSVQIGCHTGCVMVCRQQVRPWGTMECSQQAAWNSNRHMHQGLSWKTGQFRRHPNQSCAPGRLCDRVSSVSSLHTHEVFLHLPAHDQPLLALSPIHTNHHLNPAVI